MNFNDEARRFSAEVEAEAARLVRLGVPPWDALIQARQRISASRRRKVAPEGATEQTHE